MCNIYLSLLLPKGSKNCSALKTIMFERILQGDRIHRLNMTVTVSTSQLRYRKSELAIV